MVILEEELEGNRRKTEDALKGKEEAKKAER